MTFMPEPSDEELIEQIRATQRNRRKNLYMAILCFSVAFLGSMVSVYGAFVKFNSISKSINHSTEPFWTGVGLGCLVGAHFTTLTIFLIHGIVSLIMAVRRTERVHLLLLEQHDMLDQLLGEERSKERS